MEPNKYFSGIPVNTNESSVHVPTNVFDGDPKVKISMNWPIIGILVVQSNALLCDHLEKYPGQCLDLLIGLIFGHL